MSEDNQKYIYITDGEDSGCGGDCAVMLFVLILLLLAIPVVLFLACLIG